MGREEIRFSGFGGQGIILSGYIVGKAAAVFDNKFATLTQNYGPESRGGSCTAHLVVSDGPVAYPQVTSPTVQVLMSQEAFGKFGGASANGSLVLVDEDLVVRNSAEHGNLLSVPATRMAEGLGKRIMANIVMLGFFAAVTDVVSRDALREAIRTSVPAGTEELNLRAFDTGHAYGLERAELVGVL
ncbi:MAG: 2-oxoacid:acceptor oxidoreductase family protein [Chloroflexi bacterium]|nr:2-oxoacid:acceptor oxidoreductase family protein [Chloroflexota bacterium]